MRKINRGDTAELATNKGRQVFQEKWMGDTLGCRPECHPP